jgi:hypothetical protein
MLIRFARCCAAVTGLVTALSSAAFPATPGPESGKCNVNVIAWKELNQKNPISSTSPVGLPGTATSFTTAAPGCIVVQVTGFARGNVDDEAFLYFVLDGVVVTTQIFGRRGLTSELVTTTQIIRNVSAGTHRLGLRASSAFGHEVIVTPINITVHYRK